MRETFARFHIREGFGAIRKVVLLYLESIERACWEGVIEGLPALQNIFLHRLWVSGYLMQDIELFVAARQLSGRPVAVHHFG
jgi:hypothetical protein